MDGILSTSVHFVSTNATAMAPKANAQITSWRPAIGAQHTRLAIALVHAIILLDEIIKLVASVKTGF